MIRKHILLFTLSLVAASLLADDSALQKYLTYASSRRYCVSRVVQDGKIITTWHRDGRPDWILPAVETNALRTITGAPQNNPLQNQIQKLEFRLTEIGEQLKAEIANYAAASNRAEAAEKAVTAARGGLTEEREKWQMKYNSASTILKPVYKLGLDLIDGILAKMEGTAE